MSTLSPKLAGERKRDARTDVLMQREDGAAVIRPHRKLRRKISTNFVVPSARPFPFGVGSLRIYGRPVVRVTRISPKNFK
jgi:hypothetical protein